MILNVKETNRMRELKEGRKQPNGKYGEVTFEMALEAINNS